MVWTLDDAEKYVEEHRDEMLMSLMESDEVPSALKQMGGIQKLWCAGCWLGEMLEQNGATQKQSDEICFVHGQRCFGGNPLQEAVSLANEFVETGDTVDKPGAELSDRINKRVMGNTKG